MSKNKVNVTLGHHAYERLVERLSVKLQTPEKVLEQLNLIGPWFLKESSGYADEYFLGCPQIGGEFVLHYENKENEYFAKTFETRLKLNYKEKNHVSANFVRG